MRVVSAGFRDSLEAARTSDTVIVFATITHPDLSDPIRITSDRPGYDYVYNGFTYVSLGFTMSLVSDDENLPQAQCSISNVSRTIGETILSIASPPKLKIELLLKSDFTDANPRVAIGTPDVEYTAPELLLRNINVDVMTITADIVSYDLSTEPWPAIRSTPDRLPGLYR